MTGTGTGTSTSQSNELASLCTTLSQPFYKYVEKCAEEATPTNYGKAPTANPHDLYQTSHLALNPITQTQEQDTLPPQVPAGLTQDLKRKRNDNNNSEALNLQPPLQQQKLTAPRNKNTSRSCKPGYAGKKPNCKHCQYHHTGACAKLICLRCGEMGHTARSCKGKILAKPLQQPKKQPQREDDIPKLCYKCGQPGHLKKNCPQRGGPNHSPETAAPGTDSNGEQPGPSGKNHSQLETDNPNNQESAESFMEE